MFSSRKSRREAERQRLLAAARREQHERLLRTGDGTVPNTPNAPWHGELSPHAPRYERSGDPLPALLWLLGTTFSLIGGLLFGGPMFGETWRPVPLLLASSIFVITGAEALRRLRTLRDLDQIWTLSVSFLLIVVFVLGAQGQVVIDGRPYWKYSTTATAYKLAVEVRDDLYLLQENQSLLSYPPEQARGLLPLYTAAAQQAEQVAVRWNPATAPTKLPTPGFLVVYERVNAAADLQRQALLGYAAYLQQPDARLASEVDAARARAEQTYLLAAAELGSAVKPLGIDLSKQEG